MFTEDQINRWFLGQRAPAEAVALILQAVEFWDDVVDGDEKPDANAAMSGMFIHLERNIFWRNYRDMFWPIIVVAINGWLDSNAWERSLDKRKRMEAFFVRGLGSEILFMAAYLVGGWDHLRNVSENIRESLIQETFDDWQSKLGVL